MASEEDAEGQTAFQMCESVLLSLVGKGTVRESEARAILEEASMLLKTESAAAGSHAYVRAAHLIQRMFELRSPLIEPVLNVID